MSQNPERLIRNAEVLSSNPCSPAGIFLPNILGLVIEGDVLVTDDTTSQKYALEANYTVAYDKAISFT
jgi:hypothetical protein